jgi:predicted nucleotidyltransferase
MVFGSQLYGTATENSDTDYKGIFLPSPEDCFLGKVSKSISLHTGNDMSKNTKDDVDDETYSLQYFMKLALNGEMIVIDMLHAPESMIIESSETWRLLQNNRTVFYTKNLSGYIGYIRKQTAKYGVKGSRLNAMQSVLNVLIGNGKLNSIWDKLPVNEYCQFVKNEKEPRRKCYDVCGKQLQDSMQIEYAYEIVKKTFDRYGERARMAQENEGIDWKAVSHAFRAGYQLIEIYNTGDLKYPLQSADFIRMVKNGEFHYSNDGIQEKLDNMLFHVEKAASESNLPVRMSVDWIESFIINRYIGTSCAGNQAEKR